MKKIIIPSIASLLLAGCATIQPQGTFFTELQVPVAATSSSLDVSKMKVGKSSCKSFLGLVAQGDASIAAAVKNGNIKTIHAIDWKVKNILGAIGEYECIVYGE